MTKFERDAKIARVLLSVCVFMTTYSILRLISPNLPDRARLVLAVLGFAGFLCSILACHCLGYLSGFDCAIDNLLERNLIDMERYERILQLRQAADQRNAKMKEEKPNG